MPAYRIRLLDELHAIIRDVIDYDENVGRVVFPVNADEIELYLRSWAEALAESYGCSLDIIYLSFEVWDSEIASI